MRTFCDLVVKKVIRYRKDNLKSRVEPATSEPTSTPNSHPSTNFNMATALRIFTCFAPQGSGHDHTYAAYLKDHGVWLGDFDQEDSIVTSLSFNQVIDKVYAETEHGVHKNTKDGPTLNAWHAQEPKKDMWCAACRAAGRETTHDVIALHIKFVHEGDEKSHAEPMRRTVSSIVTRKIMPP